MKNNEIHKWGWVVEKRTLLITICTITILILMSTFLCLHELEWISSQHNISSLPNMFLQNSDTHLRLSSKQCHSIPIFCESLYFLNIHNHWCNGPLLLINEEGLVKWLTDISAARVTCKWLSIPDTCTLNIILRYNQCDYPLNYKHNGLLCSFRLPGSTYKLWINPRA